MVLQVKAELNYSDLLTVTDMVCSTAFDRDDEFFATAGVYRRVKIFDFAAVQDNDTSIHYPVLEIPSRSATANLPSLIPSQLLSQSNGLILTHSHHMTPVLAVSNILSLSCVCGLVQQQAFVIDL